MPLYEAFKRSRHEEPAVATSTFVRPVHVPSVKPAPTPKKTVVELPVGWASAKDAEGATYFYHIGTRETRWDLPSAEEVKRIHAAYQAQLAEENSVESILKRAQAAAEQAAAVNAALAAKAAAAAVQPTPKKSEKRKKSSHKKKPVKKEVPKEKLVMRLFSPVIVKVMTKYCQGVLARDQFKRRAKEVSSMASTAVTHTDQATFSSRNCLSTRKRNHHRTKANPTKCCRRRRSARSAALPKTGSPNCLSRKV